MALLAGVGEPKGGALLTKRSLMYGARAQTLNILWWVIVTTRYSKEFIFSCTSPRVTSQHPFPHISVSLFIFCARHSLNKTQKPNNHKKSFRWCSWSDWLQKIDRRPDFSPPFFSFSLTLTRTFYLHRNKMLW